MANKRKYDNFNASERSQRRLERVITIGEPPNERKFHPRKRTQAVMAQWVDVSPERALKAKDGEEDVPRSKAEQKESFTNINEQVSVLLLDEERKPLVIEANGTTKVRPDVLEFLNEELDIEDAGDLLEELAPSREEEEEARKN